MRPDYAAFSDEIIKIAASRWKQLLRTGDLDVADIKKLRGLRVKDPALESLEQAGKVRERAAHSADPAGFRRRFQEATGKTPDTALNYRREIEGMDRGSEAIGRKKGLRIIEGSIGGAEEAAERALSSAKSGDLPGAVRHGKETLMQGAGAASLVGGGGLAVPGKTILLNPKQNVIAGQAGLRRGSRADRGVAALTKRHEVNEQLVKAKQEAKGGRAGWLVTRAPSDELEAAAAERMASGVAPYHRAAEGLTDAAAAAESGASKVPIVGGRLKRLAGKLRGKAESTEKVVKEQLYPHKSDRVMAGKHMSPEVIMRESKDVATLPSATREAFRTLRDPAEMQMMGGRFAYGTEAPRSVQRTIMRDFERGAV